MGLRMPVEGTHNFRDVGGYPARDGRTRFGQLYRSDSLAGVTAGGAGDLALLRLGVVIDLRTDLEVRQDHSANVLPGAVRIRLPIHGGSRTSILQDGHISLEELYSAVLRDSAWSLTAVVSIIAETADDPVLVHCTAGKDRTGLAIALALEAAGVERQAVVADYTQSALNLDGEWMDRTMTSLVSNGVPISPVLFEVLGGSPDTAMTRVLARLDAAYGSVAGYLLAHGLQEDSLELLNRKLVSR